HAGARFSGIGEKLLPLCRTRRPRIGVWRPHLFRQGCAPKPRPGRGRLPQSCRVPRNPPTIRRVCTIRLAAIRKARLMSEARKTMLLLGGTSDIGRAVAAQYAARGWNIILTVRDAAAGERNAADLRVRHNANARVVTFDLFAAESQDALLRPLDATPDTVVSALGMLGDQTRAETDILHARDIIVAHFEGPSLLLGSFAEQMARRGTGTIVGISSVAGDRGRATNYVY